MTRVRGVLGLLGCVVLALVVAVLTPDPAEHARRWTSADVGTWAAGPDVAARVQEVSVVRTADPGFGQPMTSSQALVVAGVDVQVRHRVAQLDHVYLRSRDGRDYEPREEFDVAGLTETQPGFTRHATLVFEVPPRRLAGAELVVDADSTSVDVYADAIRIDLGLRDPVRISPETATPPGSTVTTT
jgi:hypothetical protein